MSDYIGMGRLTWFPRGPDPGKRCTSAHPQSAWGLQRPTRRTELHQRCTWVGRQWLWMWLTQLPRLYPMNLAMLILSIPTFGFHLLQPAPEHTVLWVTVNWIRCSEIRIGTEATQQNSCEILMPLTSLRHRIHCESLISNTSGKFYFFPIGRGKCLEGLVREVWGIWDQSQVIISEGILVSWVLLWTKKLSSSLTQVTLVTIHASRSMDAVFWKT